MWQTFQTSTVPPRMRETLWTEQTNALFPRTRVADAQPEHFVGRLAWAQLGTTTLADIASTRMNVVRCEDDVRPVDTNWMEVSLQLSGMCDLSIGRRTLRLTPAMAVLYDSRRPYRMAFSDTYRQVTLKFPRNALISRLPTLAGTDSYVLPVDGLPGRLFFSVVAQICNTREVLDMVLTERLGDHMLDLLVTSLLSSRHGLAPRGSASQQIQRQRIQSYISEHLADPDLSPLGIAHAHGISLRSLHQIFHDEPESVMTWIMNRRLDRISHDLCDTALSGWPAGKIALRHGFRDVSHFSRKFKQRFGCSPLGWRRLHTQSS